MRAIQRILLVGVLLLTSGCIVISRRVETSEEHRLPITFENAEAARLFYSTMVKPKPFMSDQTIAGLIPIGLKVEWVLHETEWYNHAVRRADIDHDGEISEQEARVLLDHYEAESAE